MLLRLYEEKIIKQAKTKRRWKSRLKTTVATTCLIVVGLYLFLLFIFPSYKPPELLEISEPDTVSLAWEYVSGGFCPNYRVLSTKSEDTWKYVGHMADIYGYNVWKDYKPEIDEEKAESIYMAITNTDKLVCTGHFKHYEDDRYTDGCIDSDYLVFQAEECRQLPLTDAEKCLQYQILFEERIKRKLAALFQAAQAGEAEAQYWLGLLYYEGRACYPQDKSLAVYWFERAAAQGHVYARQLLNEMKQELEQTINKLGEDNND